MPQEQKSTCMLAALPFYAFGMIILLSSGLHHGSQLVTLPRFEPTSFLKTIQDYKVMKAFTNKK